MKYFLLYSVIFFLISCNRSDYGENIQIFSDNNKVDNSQNSDRIYPVSFSFSNPKILSMDSLFIYPSKFDSISCYEYSMNNDIFSVYDSIFSLGGVRFKEGVDYLCKWTNSEGKIVIRNYTEIKVGYEKVYKDKIPCLESYRLNDSIYIDTRFRIGDLDNCGNIPNSSGSNGSGSN